MTEQAATDWFWTFVISGAIYLVVGWFVCRWLGPSVGLGPRNGEEVRRG